MCLLCEQFAINLGKSGWTTLEQVHHDAGVGEGQHSSDFRGGDSVDSVQRRRDCQELHG